MRVTFPRLPDYSRAYSLVERDDGVTYRLWGGSVSDRLPHDLVHLTAEDALGIGDGIWAAIAGGVVFDSMTHLGGRRPPHAAQRSTTLVRAYSASLGLAELVGGFIGRIAGPDRPDAAAVRRLATAWLSVLPPEAYPHTGMFDAGGRFDAERVLGAGERMRRAGADWRAVPVGGELVRTWPAYRRLRVPVESGVRRAGRGRRPVRTRTPA
jgi:hypothetical protein